MKVLFFGSRNASPKWLDVARACVRHACLAEPPPLDEWVAASTGVLGLRAHAHALSTRLVGEDTPLRFLHGDGPPGDAKPGKGCPLGVDRLSEVAVVLEAPRHARVTRFPVQQGEGESWALAAARRNRAMAAALPDRVYCLHTDLDSSKSSRMTAGFLHDRAFRRPFFYVRLTAGGKLVSVEERRPE